MAGAPSPSLPPLQHEQSPQGQGFGERAKKRSALALDAATACAIDDGLFPNLTNSFLSAPSVISEILDEILKNQRWGQVNHDLMSSFFLAPTCVLHLEAVHLFHL